MRRNHLTESFYKAANYAATRKLCGFVFPLLLMINFHFNSQAYLRKKKREWLTHTLSPLSINTY